MAKLYDRAIEATAAMMKAAMMKAEAEGKSDWEDKDLCEAAFLSHCFFKALKNKKIISAMNYLMMLWYRGEQLALNEQAPILQTRENDMKLMATYQVNDLYALVDMQQNHIEQLQKALQAARKLS